MRGEPGFFDVEERLRELTAKGDELERLNGVVDFELFRADLERAVPRSDRSKGGRPAFDHVLMFRVLILQTSHSLSDERTEYLVKDRLSFMRFLGLGLADTVPDANTIWTFREALTRARLDGKPAIEVLFARFEAALSAAGFLAKGGQIIDATIVAAPKQRNTDGEKRDIKEGRVPAEARQAAPEGPRRALDGQIHQGQAERGGCAPRRPRDPGLRLQEPYRDRPLARSDPHLDHDRRVPPRWCGAGARRGRACLRPPERADGSVYPHHRHCPRQNQDRLGQYRLQHEASALAHHADRASLTKEPDGAPAVGAPRHRHRRLPTRHRKSGQCRRKKHSSWRFPAILDAFRKVEPALAPARARAPCSGAPSVAGSARRLRAR